jgi:hypothetical protein
MTEQEYYLFLQQDEANLEYKYIDLEYAKKGTSGYRYIFEYLNEHTRLKDIYNLENIAGNDSTLSKALNIMQWLSDRTYYCGQSNLSGVEVFSILEYALKGGFDHAIRCDQKSVALSECLLAVNIFAYPVMLESYDYNDSGNVITGINCHNVTHIYLPEEEKWIMFDPSFNAFFTDGNGKILNIIEIKDTLKKREPVILSQYSLNGHDDIFRKKYPYDFIYNLSFRISVWDGNNPANWFYNKNLLYPDSIDKQKYYVMKQRANGGNENDINASISSIKYIFTDELLAVPSFNAQRTE